MGVSNSPDSPVYSHHTDLRPDQAMAPWDVPHQAVGSPAPVVNPERVTVYNMRFCPYAQRTILTLLAKNIPFDVVNINLKSKPEWFLEQTWPHIERLSMMGFVHPE